MISFPLKSRQQIRQESRKEVKLSKQLEKAEARSAIKIKQLLREVLSDNVLNEIAVKNRFHLRARKLTAFSMIAVLLLGCYNGTEDVSSLETMCCYLSKWFNIHMRPQSLQEQLNSKECADFVKEVSIRVMMHEGNKVIAKLFRQKKKFKSNIFQRILLQDSSVISLPETLSRIFRGCGGAASKAAVKCDIIFDQTSHLILRCKCLSGRIPDVSLSEDILSFAEEGDLVIRDLGYFNLSHFTIMKMKKIKFISRLRSDVSIYLNENDEKGIDIIEHLEKLRVNAKKIDLDVYIGKKERIHVRLIGIKVPEEVIKTRIQQYKKARGISKNPSEDLLIWYGYTLMITNITQEQMSLDSILKMYRVRWQIELFFKNMKSQLKVDNFTGRNKNRILCLLYIKLALTWISTLLYVLGQMLAGKECIVSSFKFTKWLHNLGGWQNVITKGDLTELIKDFKRDQHLLRKQVKKKNKQENLNEKNGLEHVIDNFLTKINIQMYA